MTEEDNNDTPEEAAADLDYWTFVCFEGMKDEPAVAGWSDERRLALARDMATEKLKRDAELRAHNLPSSTLLERMEGILHLGGFSDQEISELVQDGGDTEEGAVRVVERRLRGGPTASDGMDDEGDLE